MVNKKEEKYEVVIIGAGPAGLRAAEVLVKAGKEVLVLEKGKEIGQKICGGGLSIKNTLMGLPVKELGERLFFSVKYHFQRKTRVISKNRPLLAITERTRLGQYMLNSALEKGVKIRLNSPVELIGENFITAGNEKIYFDYLIGADGSNSLVRRFLKIPTEKSLLSLGYEIKKHYKDLECFFDSRIFRDGYGAIFPHKNYTQIGITIDSKFAQGRKAKKILDKWLNQMKISPQDAQLKAGIINYDYRGFQFGNKFLVGDAAGFASGLTGEGIFQALVSGQEVARKITDPSYKCQGIKHILTQKFIHEKILKKLLRIKNKFLSRLIYEILAISSEPTYYNLFYKLKPFPKQL